MKEGRFEEIRRVVENHKVISDEAAKDDDYRVDRYAAREYFSGQPEWLEKVKVFFDELHKKGEKVVHVDLCGRANALNIGADVSYLFSLKPPELRKAMGDSREVFVDGSIFDVTDFRALTEMIKEESVSPALVTFVPVAGLKAHIPKKYLQETVEKEITYGILEKRLFDMIDMMRPGGYMYVTKPFDILGLEEFLQGKEQKNYKITERLKELLKGSGCTISMKEQVGGPVFLIHKKDNKAKENKVT